MAPSEPSADATRNPHEALMLQEFENLFVSVNQGQASIEMLAAAHFQRRQAKELPVSGNPAEVQCQGDEAKELSGIPSRVVMLPMSS